MIKPDAPVIKGLAQAIQQYPEVLAWVEGLLVHEMKRLPYAIDNSAVFQGRCQMLVELIEFAKESPAIAAKLK